LPPSCLGANLFQEIDPFFQKALIVSPIGVPIKGGHIDICSIQVPVSSIRQANLVLDGFAAIGSETGDSLYSLLQLVGHFKFKRMSFPGIAKVDIFSVTGKDNKFEKNSKLGMANNWQERLM